MGKPKPKPKPKKAPAPKRTAPARSTIQLSPKLRAFAHAYAGKARGNATEAARIAGYSGSDAVLAVRGSEAVRNRKVQALIAELERDTRSAEIADRTELQRILTAIARGEGTEPHVLQSGATVYAPPTFAAKAGAAMSLAKMRGYLIDKIEVKAADQLRSQLEQIRKRMPADAFEALLEALVADEG